MTEQWLDVNGSIHLCVGTADECLLTKKHRDRRGRWRRNAGRGRQSCTQEGKLSESGLGLKREEQGEIRDSKTHLRH